MVTYAYDYSFLLKTLKYIFLPILAVVIIVGFIVFMYSRKTKKENIEKYNYIIDLWTTLLAITVIGALFAITLGFSLSLTKTIRIYDLIKGHEIIYYLVIATPVVPLIFLCIYLYKFVVTIFNKPKTAIKNEEKKVQNIIKEPEDIEDNHDIDYNIDFTNFNEEKESDQAEQGIETNVAEEKQKEEIDDAIHIDDLPDKVMEENHDDIELL